MLGQDTMKSFERWLFHAAAREGDDAERCSYSAVLYGGQKDQH